MAVRMPGYTSVMGGVILLTAVTTAALAANARASGDTEETLTVLAPALASTIRVDTGFVGGYARGNFGDALLAIGSELSDPERVMIGRHLDKMFDGVLAGGDMERGGRLRVAYERSARPDGTTRGIRVLAAEAAVGGRLHTVFYFEKDGKPAYFDALGQALSGGEWMRPLATTRVSSPYGLRRLHPLLHRILPHTGVDYAATTGTPVRATGDGSVSSAGWRGGYGRMVEIQHPNGYATRYAHLSRIAAEASSGRAVRQGDVIGYVGMTGRATGPHLHYEVRRQGQPVDPERLSAFSGPAADVRTSADWSIEHRRLAGLLAQAPRETRGR